MLISVIVPVYNVERYVGQCLESLLHQSYRDLEVIVVDDGSTDSSLQVVRQVVGGDARVRVLEQANAGLSAARNTGIEQASGDYLYFLDSDDYLAPDHLQNLVAAAHEAGGQVDMVTSHYSLVDEAGQLLPNHVFGQDARWGAGSVLGGEEALECYFATKARWVQPMISNQAWGKLLARHLFDGLRFPQVHFEDLATTYQLLHRSRRIVLTENTGYNYRSRSGSIMNGGIQNYHSDLISIWREMAEFIEKEHPKLRSVFSYRAYLELMNWAVDRIPVEHELYSIFYREAQRYRQVAALYPATQNKLLWEGRLGVTAHRFYRKARIKVKYLRRRGAFRH